MIERHPLARSPHIRMIAGACAVITKTWCLAAISALTLAAASSCGPPDARRSPGGNTGDGGNPPPAPVRSETYIRTIAASGNAAVNDLVVDAAGSVYLTGETTAFDFPVTEGAYDVQCGTDGVCNGNPGQFEPPHADAFVMKLGSDGRVIYSSYVGGSSDDIGRGIAVDAEGNAYVVGETHSIDFPASTESQRCSGFEAFAIKLNPSGSRLSASRCFGGEAAEVARDVALDNHGHVYMTGYTASRNFPVLNAVQPVFRGSLDVFILKLEDSRLAPLYATYLGGSGQDTPTKLTVDPEGNVLVTGSSASADFPAVRGLQQLAGSVDAFVTKLDSSGSTLVFSTLIGGKEGAGIDIGNAVSVDADGNCYVAGWTDSGDFPATRGAIDTVCGTDGTCNHPLSDGFVLSLDRFGGLRHASFIGGSRDDIAHAIAVRPDGRTYVTGNTQSADFPSVLPFATSWVPATLNDVMFLWQQDANGMALRRATLVPFSETRPRDARAIAVGGQFVYIAGLAGRGFFVQKLNDAGWE